jgi:hypothetical protein
MKKFLLLPCLLITLLSLNNCTNYIRGDITTFSDGFFVEPGTKIIVVPITTAQQNSIEFRTYQNLLSKFLAQNAFNIVSGKDIKPDMVATLSYDIDEGRTMRYIDYQPVNRVKGYVDETVGYYEYGRYYQRTEKRPITELGFEKVIRTKFVYTANINPSLSYKIADDLSIGAGFVAQFYQANLNQAVNFGAGDSKAELIGNDWGYGYNLGMNYKINDKLKIGAGYRSKIDYQLSGTTKIKDLNLYSKFIAKTATPESSC